MHGVRPEVAVSWQRCRDRYRVDPHLAVAPMAVSHSGHPIEHDAVFTELGFRCAVLSHEVASGGGIVLVTDAGGRVLAEWGDRQTREIAAASGLAPWFSWSEGAVGTNGMGTALATRSAVVTVRQEEHWCQAFHDWTCAGVAVRDPVSGAPIAALNISCWRSDLPRCASTWLGQAASSTQSVLRTHARATGSELLAAFEQARSESSDPLVAADTAGKIVMAGDRAAVLLGVPGDSPALDPVVRWTPQLPAFVHAVREATRQAGLNPDWTGSTQVATFLADDPTPIGIRPVFLRGSLIGHLVTFGSGADGDPLPVAQQAPAETACRRIVGTRGSRAVLLRPSEVMAAEADGNEVWLLTDQGRLRAAATGLERFEEEVAGSGFIRVHRRYVVNINRIREVERRDKSELVLVLDDAEPTMIAVSRRNARTVRSTLGL